MDFEKEALEYHRKAPSGKIYTGLAKSVKTQTDLALAYSPGVAGPCREIARSKDESFVYTGRGNLVGVVSNGSAVLGLGNIGPYAAKPVMEGKAMLFKKFADIDVFDIELDCPDADAFIDAVAALEPTFGGINLEDIKAPQCFYIEQKLRERMSIPVFHDDQHGTAIIAGSAFLNALEITNRKIEDVKITFSGAGAAAIACAHLFISLGLKKENLFVCDSKGVLHKERSDLNEYKSQFVVDTDKRTLEDAIEGCDAFLGVSGPDILTAEMLKSMAANPIIFALANPDPEIHPNLAKEVRPDAIIATGRSDFPNQVNNVLGFPFIFRGALDVRAKTINEEMKLAAVRAIAELAKEDVPDVVRSAYKESEGYVFGRDYLIPKPMDPRVLLKVAPAVARAAIDSGVARRNIDMNAYPEQIEQILGPTRILIRSFRNVLQKHNKNNGSSPLIVLADGYDRRAIRAAAQVAEEGEVKIALLGNKGRCAEMAERYQVPNLLNRVQVIDPLHDPSLERYADMLFSMRQRRGISRSQATYLTQLPYYFASLMVKSGDADGLISGLGAPYSVSVKSVLDVIEPNSTSLTAGIYMIVHQRKMYFFADATINTQPNSEELAEIAMRTAKLAERYTDDPIRVAILSYSSFGSSKRGEAAVGAKAVEILREKYPELTVDGEMQGDVALRPDLQEAEFPFCQLGGSANVLIFPNLSAANISQKILASLSDVMCTGPILVGVSKPVNVMQRSCDTDDVINMVYLTAHDAVRQANLE